MNTAALTDRAGSIDWLCLPRYDSPAVFARILDPDAGHWSIRPAAEFTADRRYLGGTLVLETTFQTDTGTARLTDALVFAEGQRGHDLGYNAPRELLRLVAQLSGSMTMVMELVPRPEYGLVRPLFRSTEYGGRTFGGPNQIAVCSGARAEIEGSAMRAEFDVMEGGGAGFRAALGRTGGRLRSTDTRRGRGRPDRGHGGGLALVGSRTRHLRGSAPRARAVQHTGAEGSPLQATGAIVAAPTTSLPETVGGERNWDIAIPGSGTRA